MYGYGYAYLNNPQGNGLLGRYEAGVRSDGGSFAFPIDTGLASRLEGLGLLNASSLVNSCNAGKESVLYNLVPTPVQALDRFTVARAGTKWVLGANGLLTEVQANFPAFEYNADGTYRGLSVEPAATNLCLRSEDLGATWAFADATSSLNSASSPNGALTADSIIDNTTNTFHGVAQNFTVTSGIAYTISAFFKANTLTWVRLAQNSSAGGSTQVNAWYNLATGVVGTVGAGGTARIENYGNGWYRCSLTVTTTGTSFQYAIRTATADNQTTYAGTEQSLLFWGAQLETGSVATSYIPTVASTANRVADSVTLTGASSLIGQTEGTLYVEAIFANVANSNFARVLECFTGASDRISILINASSARGFITTAGVDTQGGTMSEAVANNTIYRIALAYAVGASQGAFYVNGTGDITSPTAIPATASINMGQNIAGALVPQWIRSAVLFTTRLNIATLASLTTP